MRDALIVRDGAALRHASPAGTSATGGNGRPAGDALPVRQALALGLLHGPAELLPISSSGHTVLVPWLLGWRYEELDPSARKSFEVALHAGTALGLLVRPPWSGSARIGLRALLCAVTPPALAGYLLGERIERRLSSPPTIAAGLLGGSLAMAAAELRAAHLRQSGLASSARASTRDGLALGLAQAAALAPGVSRSGLAFAAMRARGFYTRDADRLSWKAGLPVIAGAALLKGSRLARAGVPHELGGPLAAGAGGALASTLLSAGLLTSERRARLLPAAISYRICLAALVIRRMRDNTSSTPNPSP